MHYLMYPDLYAKSRAIPSHFIGIDKIQFGTLQDAVNFARQTKICLREENWYVYQCGFITKYRIPLHTLYLMGLFKPEIKKDNFGEYYQWKD